MVSHNGQGESNLSRQHTRLTTCPSQRKTFWIENYRPPRSHASFARLQVLQLYSWAILSLEQEIVDHGPTRYWWRMERCGISKCKHLSSIWSWAKWSILSQRRSMAMVRVHSFPGLMEDCICPSPWEWHHRHRTAGRSYRYRHIHWC